MTGWFSQGRTGKEGDVSGESTGRPETLDAIVRGMHLQYLVLSGAWVHNTWSPSVGKSAFPYCERSTVLWIYVCLNLGQLFYDYV